MNNDKPEVRSVPVYYVQVLTDSTASTGNGEYRAQLDFALPYNGKRQRLFRMRVSPCDIAYLRECLDKAEAVIRDKFNKSFGKEQGK